jgi:transcriptional regulator of nitric oxide reductase
MPKQHLSKTELAALDLMIAHMQENKKEELGSFIDDIVDAVSAAAAAVSAGAAVVAARAATAIAEAAPVAEEVAEVAAAAMAAHANTAEINELLKKLNSDKLKGQLTLANLIKIRNQASK